MLNFHIIKVNLKNGEIRYRTILTKSGKGIKTKTFDASKMLVHGAIVLFWILKNTKPKALNPAPFNSVV